jgi:hypothetical protein
MEVGGLPPTFSLRARTRDPGRGGCPEPWTWLVLCHITEVSRLPADLGVAGCGRSQGGD